MSLEECKLISFASSLDGFRLDDGKGVTPVISSSLVVGKLCKVCSVVCKLCFITTSWHSYMAHFHTQTDTKMMSNQDLEKYNVPIRSKSLLKRGS